MSRIDERIYGQYYAALTRGDRRRCVEIAQGLLDDDVPLEDLYLGLYQRSLYDIGAGWERNEISVATEHVATAITQGLLQLSYSRLFAAERLGRSVVMACTPGEYHQIGAMVITDMMELWGWDTHFVGANTPIEDLLKLLGERRPDLVALSVSLSINLPALIEAVRRIREAFPQQPIIAGGQGLAGLTPERRSELDGVEILGGLAELREHLARAAAEP